MRENKGFTLTELLVAVIISMIILLALTSLFIVGNKTFKSNKEISDINEDVKNAITTLDFLFSRWGAGVPCPDEGCNLQSPPPDCSSYPPKDPMCITIIDRNQIIFYGNLYGLGFVKDVNNSNAGIISCRLSSSVGQNCYYVWNGGKLKGGYNGETPRYFSFSTFPGSQDCITYKDVNLTVSSSLIEPGNQNPQTITLSPGDYITRVPHQIKIYVNNGKLYMDRTDMASVCKDNENSVMLGNVSKFLAQKEGRSVRLDITFIDSTGKTFSITRYYGR
ncbi:MAG: prepilin-type N-terminal cleavage/methylation domain-containing protein [Hydrogenothermaceae bacterium]|nr:prepilin-type N-terminal cleavage/methylation domain-containing protein [Hydrogenothermaceae bacterium]